MLCQDCSKKPTCTELCSEAEEYVSQDHIPIHKQAVTIGNDIEDITDEPENLISNYQKDSYSSPELKRLIIELYCDGKTESEIAYHLPCSQQYINRVTTKFKTNPLKSLDK